MWASHEAHALLSAARELSALPGAPGNGGAARGPPVGTAGGRRGVELRRPRDLTSDADLSGRRSRGPRSQPAGERGIRHTPYAVAPVPDWLRPARCRCAVIALLVAVIVIPSAALAASGGAGLGPTGGAPSGGLDPGPAPAHKSPAKKTSKGSWLRGVNVTEYWPVPESWFVGRLVRVPGLAGMHRIDWLYSALGVSMQGEGIGLDGELYHIASLGNAGWVTSAGKATAPSSGGWSGGPPYWRAGGFWLGRARQVTYPLLLGGWSNGPGVKYVPLRGVSFAAGPSLPLKYYQSIAVDPNVIALGSRVYIPAYRHDGHGGWFVAQDTGGAIIGRHVDVFRTPPALPTDPGMDLTDQRIWVIPPRR